MRRQKQVDQACERCRRKRTKCDGTQPCHRCQVAGEECEFSVSKSASKDQLRAEIQRLKNIIVEKESTSASEESESTKIKDEEGNSSLGTSRTSVGSSWHWYQLNKPATHSSFDLLLSWRQCRPNIGLSAIKSKPLTALSLPPMPLGAFGADTTLDTWTNTGWTKAHVRHIFDAIITWDYLPLSLLRKDAFLQDYDGDSHRFCSSALVHSVLALSTLLINGNEDHLDTLRSGWFGSQQFHDAAERCLGENGASFSLPDVQALGIMSLYRLRRGEESEALEVVQAFLQRATELCEQDIPLEFQTDNMYAIIRDTTYYGAVSLVRLLSLTTGQLFIMKSSSEHENTLDFDEYLLNMDKLMLSHSPIRTDFPAAELYDAQIVATKLFQLIQWVHTSITSALTSPQGDESDIKAVYTKCLAWYSDFFSLLSDDSSRTPFILFTHICYHFSLLCAFRPFVMAGIPHSELNSIELCSQAAQSVLLLVQSYDDLFTLRRVSSLVPYFVLASGLFGQAMENNGSEIEPTYLLLRDQVPAMKQAKAGEQEFIPNQQQRSPNSAYIQVSMVDHARFLLAKMGLTHPGAKTAESKLAVG